MIYVFASKLCIQDLIINIYRAIRLKPNNTERTHTYLKPIIEYMTGYDKIEIKAALNELERQNLIITSYDEIKDDIKIIDFTEQGYNEYRSLFTLVDENDLQKSHLD